MRAGREIAGVTSIAEAMGAIYTTVHEYSKELQLLVVVHDGGGKSRNELT